MQIRSPRGPGDIKAEAPDPQIEQKAALAISLGPKGVSWGARARSLLILVAIRSL